MRFSLQSLNLLNSYETIGERLPYLTSWVAENPPTVFAGQEVLTDQHEIYMVHQATKAVFSDARMTTAIVGKVLDGQNSGNAIWYQVDALTLITAGAIELLEEPSLRYSTPTPVYAIFRDAAGAEIIVLNVHLSWGAEKSAVRYRNLRTVIARANELLLQFPMALVVMVGDFNAPPANDEMRFLRGETLLEPGEFWIDAWDWLNRGDPGFTQYPSSKYAAQTARGVGITDSSTLPERRIDFMMIRGWSYAALGTNPEMKLWGGPDIDPVSDHLGMKLSFDF